MTRRAVVLALVLTVSLSRDAWGQRYLDASGRLRVSLAQQPLTPNGRSSGPRTMVMGGIQDSLLQLGASVRTAEAALTAVEDTEYGGWKRLGMSLGHFADIVARNERDGVFTVGLLATCPSMPGLVAGLQHSGPTAAPITVGMLWLDAHPDFNTPETTRSGSLGGMPVAVATGRALPRLRLDAKLDPAMRDDHVVMGGVRLTDPLEQELLDASGIRQVSVNDLRTRSAALFAQLDRLHRDTDKLYIHVDMDVLDPREVMGHGNKVPDGPSSEELAALFEEIFRRYPKASAIGFATIPPTDEGGLSIAALNRMIAGAVRGVQARERAATRPAAEPLAPARPARSGNPILAGWYADPEAHVFDGQYWIYPTYSAPYGEQTFMDAFSSRDLLTWEKHARVLDTANVRWARRALWAPSIVQKGGWYYLFFGANDIQNDQQLGGIGVARARSPAGPFKDMLGKPLIGAFHNGAQPIDQMVFQDLDGAYYIVYGGWRHCNIAKLNDDFTGFVPFPDGSTFKEITPAGYVEGAYMLVKDGKYYFMWSEGGWTGPNYAVAYAIGTSPFGPFERVGRILQQDSTVATGAGHHSVLHTPGSNNWYIVYHRRPHGETDRNHRVVSIDELRFDARGFIQPVAITRTGVAADPLPSAPTLQGAYDGAFLVGSAVNEAIVSGSDSVARDIALRQFNSITAENVLKAEHVNPQPGVFTFGPADAFVEFGTKHGMFIVGHMLVWHNQTPAWFFHETGKPNTRDAQLERMRSHIEAVAGRYVGKIHAWDVVNEVIDNDGSYRPTTWVTGIGDGDSLVKSAFRFASRYAPGTELYYNGFNAWRPAKRDGIVRLVRMLQKEGIRIDGVGMQGHWGLNYPRTEYIEAAIDSFAALGVKVMITELDVDVLPLTREGQIIGQVMTNPQFQLEEFKKFLDPYRNGLPDDVQKQLADRYAELFGIFYRKRDKLDRVTLWGVHDGMSWKNGYPVPGRTNYPLLYSRELKPKPAFDAVLAVPRSP